MQSFYTPLAIVIAGVLIAGSVLYVNGERGAPPASAPATGTEGSDARPDARHPAVSPVRAEHRNVRGPADAPITIVEFSDYECPFCARHHPTLQRVLAESDGEVNWEYRHLPLSIHRHARPAAIAAECVAEIGGGEAFWAFTDTLFERQRELGQTLYENVAGEIGIPAGELRACQERDDIAARVDADARAAAALGGTGTPFSVIVYADGRIRPVSGALPYEQFAPLVN